MTAKAKDTANSMSKGPSVDSQDDFASLSKLRFSTAGGSTTIGPANKAIATKYTVDMAKQLILESFLTPRARQLYKNSVQVASTTYSVQCYPTVGRRAVLAVGAKT